MKTTVSDIPNEVWQVKAIQFSKQPVGLQTLNKVKEVIAKYPEHFAWEHKYDSLPKEVHEAFLNEAYPKKVDFLPESINSGEGVLAQLNKNAPVYNGGMLTEELLMDFMNKMQDEANNQWERERRITKIWDKHYKKYGLECREF